MGSLKSLPLPMTDLLLVPVSAGELFDKISILQIKRERIADAAKRAHVVHELRQLDVIARDMRSACTASKAGVLQQLEAELLAINQRLWDLENTVRAFDAAGEFGEAFVAAARAIYAGNDERAAVKRRINLLLGSAIVEAKEHEARGKGA